jgi:hypothetical protein
MTFSSGHMPRAPEGPQYRPSGSGEFDDPRLIGLIVGEVVGLALVAPLIVTGAAGRRPRRLALDDHRRGTSAAPGRCIRSPSLVLAIDG